MSESQTMVEHALREQIKTLQVELTESGRKLATIENEARLRGRREGFTKAMTMLMRKVGEFVEEWEYE